MLTSPHECELCTHHISSLTAPGLYLAEWLQLIYNGPHFLQKNCLEEFSGYGPAYDVPPLCPSKHFPL